MMSQPTDFGGQINWCPPKQNAAHFLSSLQKLDSWPTTDLQHSGSSSGGSSSNAMSPAQFYAHRDHVFGGSLSKLDRMRSHQDSLLMEAFDETEEYEGTDQNGENVITS